LGYGIPEFEFDIVVLVEDMAVEEEVGEGVVVEEDVEVAEIALSEDAFGEEGATDKTEEASEETDVDDVDEERDDPLVDSVLINNETITTIFYVRYKNSKPERERG